jgi:hypothetical protein
MCYLISLIYLSIYLSVLSQRPDFQELGVSVPSSVFHVLFITRSLHTYNAQTIFGEPPSATGRKTNAKGTRACARMGGSSSEEDALPTGGAGGASSGESGSESEGGSGSDSSTDSGPAAPCPTCPDCGESFIQEGAVLKCRCGVERPASTVTPAVRTPQPRTGKPPSGKRRLSKTPPKVSKSQKFQMDVSSRLSLGVPSFVLKDASALYNKALKADRPKGCSDIGLALAALEHALRKHKLEPPRPELCTAAQSKVAPHPSHPSPHLPRRLPHAACPRGCHSHGKACPVRPSCACRRTPGQPRAARGVLRGAAEGVERALPRPDAQRRALREQAVRGAARAAEDARARRVGQGRRGGGQPGRGACWKWLGLGAGLEVPPCWCRSSPGSRRSVQPGCGAAAPCRLLPGGGLFPLALAGGGAARRPGLAPTPTPDPTPNPNPDPNQAEELRAGLDSPPLVLAAAICILVFERHTPKEKITPGKVAKSAGQEHDQVMERYIEP